MKIGFIMGKWESITPEKNSSLRVIHECITRGYTVAILQPGNLAIRRNVVVGFSRIIQKQRKVPTKVLEFYKVVKFKEKLLNLAEYDCIFIRKDPPLDPFLLNFLDSIKDHTLILNDIDGLRKASNKIYAATIHDPNLTFLPVTHVSKNKEYLKTIINESKQEKMILKPLDGSGGSGVIVLEKSAKSNINSLLDFYIGEEEVKRHVIIQDYIEGAEKGDIRVLLLDGKVLGAYKRVPAQGELRANIHVGGKAEKVRLSDKQISLCKKIGPKLAADGLYFVGLDIIGSKVLEINVLNPGGIVNINRLNKVKLQKKVVDFIEEKVSEKDEKRAELEYLLKRISDIRKK